MPARADRSPRRTDGAWYRQPVVWLGILVFVASIAGCVWIISVGMQHADSPLETSHGRVFGVPTASRSAASPAHPASGP